MTMLPDSIINNIMKYVSHPVADVFKAHVSVMPGVMENNPDVITIGIHDGNHMYADNVWFTKERECHHYSNTMEEFVVFNILKNEMKYLKTIDTFDCPMFRKITHVIRNIDPTFLHIHKNIINSVLAEGYEKMFRASTEHQEEYRQYWDEIKARK